MSDILIKGNIMAMPSDCEMCPLSSTDDYNAYCPLLDRFVKLGYMLKACPLVEVPEHGRLIDADGLESVLDEVNGYGGASEINYQKIIEVLHDPILAPTIVEASE